jgi:hypothetical protein
VPDYRNWKENWRIKEEQQGELRGADMSLKEEEGITAAACSE